MGYAGAYRTLTPEPDVRAYVVWAVVGHVVLLVLMSLAITNSVRLAKPMK